VGRGPAGVAFNSFNNEIYVANLRDNTVSAITTELPVLLVHGINSSAKGAWEDSFNFAKRLRDRGYSVWLFDYSDKTPFLLNNTDGRVEIYGASSLPGSTFVGPLELFALALSAGIATMKQLTGATKIDIIAHSMGGLISRWYLQQGTDQDRQGVQKLIMLGTPNHGTPLASLNPLRAGCLTSLSTLSCLKAVLLPLLVLFYDVGNLGSTPKAMQEMAVCSAFINTLNAGYFTKHCYQPGQTDYVAPGVQYFTAIGNKSSGGESSSGEKFLGELMPGSDNDGLVPAWSARIYNPLVTASMMAQFPLGHVELHENTTVLAKVVEWLKDDPSPTLAVSQSSAMAEYPVSQAPQIVDSIIAGQVKTHRVVVSFTDSTFFGLVWDNGSLGFDLVMPNGTIVSPKSSVASYLNGTNFAGYAIDHPAQGTWRAVITATRDAGYVLSTVLNGPLNMSLILNQKHFQPGDHTVIGTAIGVGGTPVTGATVSAIINNPDGFRTSVPLADVASNGTYITTYSNNTLGGYYGVTVNASGSVGGDQFYRSMTSDFFVDLSISASPPRAANVGLFAVSILTVDSVGGLPGRVSLSDNPPPSGLTCLSIAPGSIDGSGTATLSCSSTIANTYRITITATSDTLISSTTATFTFLGVVPETTTALNCNPSSLVVNQVSTCTAFVKEVTGTAGYSLVDNIPVGNVPTSVAVDPNTDTIYVGNYYSKTVSVISGSTNTVIATIPVPSGANGLAVDPTTNVIYVMGYGNTSVISGSSNTLVATIPVPLCSRCSPASVAVNPVTDTIYETFFGSTSVYVISGTSDRVVRAIPVGGGPCLPGTAPYCGTSLNAIAVDTHTNTIYVTHYNPYSVQGTVSVISGSSNTVKTSIAVGANPAAIAVNPNTDMVYVASFFWSTVTVISGASNNVVASINADENLFSIAVNPSSNTIYAAQLNGYWFVDAISGSSNSLVGEIPTGGHANSIAVNSNTNTVYVTNQDFNQLSVITPNIKGSPKGTVNFSIATPSVSTSDLSSANCSLSAVNSTTSSCSVTFKALETGSATIEADYGGESIHGKSQGSASLRVSGTQPVPSLPFAQYTLYIGLGAVAIASLVGAAHALRRRPKLRFG
jgi:YVTN family beta-propeller protein